jgi:predicted nuclease of predicted toxin-antitoxin system
VKLDENIPASTALVAVDIGHDVATVIGENLIGATDADVLSASTRDERILVTLDRGFGDLRAYPPGTHGGIVVLRVDSHDAGLVAEALRSFLANDQLGDLTGCITVIRGHLVRIRRPE